MAIEEGINKNHEAVAEAASPPLEERQLLPDREQVLAAGAMGNAAKHVVEILSFVKKSSGLPDSNAYNEIFFVDPPEVPVVRQRDSS